MSSEVSYYFNSKSTTVWTDAAKMIDHILTNYATTSSDGDIEILDGNTCSGTDLGSITKVEIRAYGYGDGDDRIDLTPIFSGGDGDEHQTTPGVTAGWGAFQDITSDMNHPTFKNDGTGSYDAMYDNIWRYTIFTPEKVHTINYVKLKLSRTGTPSGTLTVGIRLVDSNHKPTGNDLTSGTIATSSISSTAWHQINLTEYSLSADTEYCIVCRLGTGEGDVDNCILWQKGEDTTGFGVSSNSGSSWTYYSGYSSNYDFEKLEWSWLDI